MEEPGSGQIQQQHRSGDGDGAEKIRPDIVRFVADRENVDWGDLFQLEWLTSGGDSLRISELGRDIPQSGKLTLTADRSHPIYTLVSSHLSDEGRTVESVRTAAVTVNPPEIVDFSAGSREVAAGRPVTVGYTVRSVRECTLYLNGAAVATGRTGSFTTSLNETSTFTLHASGVGEIVRELIIVVVPAVEKHPLGKLHGYAVHQVHNLPPTLLAGTAAAGTLDFTVGNAEGKPELYTGDSAQNKLTLTMTNGSTSPVTFTAGTPVSEVDMGTTVSALYITFAEVMDADQFSKLEISAPGWTPRYFTQGGVTNWGLFPTQNSTLQPSASVIFTITKISVLNQPKTGLLTVDFMNMKSLRNGSRQLTVMSRRPPQALRDLDLGVELTGGNTVEITGDGREAFPNSLVLTLSNKNSRDPVVPPASPADGTTPPPVVEKIPTFTLSFVYGASPGYWALCTKEEASRIGVSLNAVPVKAWEPKPHTGGASPYWELLPKTTEILGTGEAGIVSFKISNIVTRLEGGSTLLYLRYCDIPGYNDGYYALSIVKQPAVPTIVSFGFKKETCDWGEAVDLEWKTRGADYCRINKLEGSLPLSETRKVTVTSETREMTLFCGAGTPSQPRGQVQLTSLIDINPPRIEFFRSDKDVTRVGGAVTVTWSVRSVATCELLMNKTVVASGPSGTFTANPSADTVFELRAVGAGRVVNEIVVRMARVRIISFTENPIGGMSSFAWEVENATSITIHSSRGTRGPSEFRSVEPSRDSHITRGTFFDVSTGHMSGSHSLMCSGGGGSSDYASPRRI